MNESVLICLYLLSEQKRMEVLVDTKISFSKLLSRLQLKDSEKRVIVEKKSGIICDRDVSLQSLGVRNCMRFLIY